MTKDYFIITNESVRAVPISQGIFLRQIDNYPKCYLTTLDPLINSDNCPMAPPNC